MHLPIRLILSIVIAALAWAALHFFPQIPLAAALVVATLLTALLPAAPAPAAQRSAAVKPAPGPAASADEPREQGQVKWFNVSKGFGFITKDNGEEIFVHFRSIRGEGHRSLRDGQRVSFVEAQTDKGPQAEDVVEL